MSETTSAFSQMNGHMLLAVNTEHRRWQRTGYVYRRGDSWFGQFRVDTAELDERGRFKRKTLTKFIAAAAGPGKVLKTRAQQIFFDEHLKSLPKSGPLSALTLAEFVAQAFKPQVVLRCKPSGQAHYDYILEKHVLPALGEYMMRDIRPQHVYNLVKAKLDWRNDDNKALSIQTIHHIRNTVSSVFRHAKRMQAYSGDLPTEGVRLPVLEHKERRALTWNQVQQLAALIGYPDPGLKRHKLAPKIDSKDALAKQAEDNLQLGALVKVLALTGLRIGEAMGLRWKHVDLEGGILHVRDNYVRGKYGTLKTARSRRDVPLHSTAIAELIKLQQDAGPHGTLEMAVNVEKRAGIFSDEAQAGYELSRTNKTDMERRETRRDSRERPALPGSESPVFAGRESGKPLDQHNVASRFLRPAGKRAGIPWVSWHALRHTADTLGFAAGVSLEERQKILGHSSPAMTIHYTHPDLEALREKLEKIGKVN